MKPGRNDPCPCGSGKKYKKCCMKVEPVAAGREESVRVRLVQDLLQFFKKNFEDRLDDADFIFWDDFDPEKYLNKETIRLADINFWEWIVYDYVIDEGDNWKGQSVMDGHRLCAFAVWYEEEGRRECI